MTDEGLMSRVQNGDHGAFSVLVHRHTRLFYAAAYRMCSDQDDAEDIVQDAFLKLWKKPAVWDASRGTKFTTWFYRVVTNQAIDYMRKKKPSSGHADIIEALPDGRAGQHEVFAQGQQQDILERAIQDLPERQKIALNLCFYEGMSNKEAAGILDISVKALESLLMRAKSGLKDTLLRHGVLGQEERKEGGFYG